RRDGHAGLAADAADGSVDSLPANDRTCGHHVGCGDGAAHAFRLVALEIAASFLMRYYEVIYVRFDEWNDHFSAHLGYAAGFNQNLSKYPSVLQMCSCVPITHPCFGLGSEKIGKSLVRQLEHVVVDL